MRTLEQPQLDVLAMQLCIALFTALLPNILPNDRFIPVTGSSALNRGHSTTAQPSVGIHVRDAHVAWVGSNEVAARDTTTVLAHSSNDP